MTEIFYVYRFMEADADEELFNKLYATRQKLTPDNIKDFAKAAGSFDRENTKLVNEFSGSVISYSEVKFVGEATADEVKTLKRFEIIPEVIDLEGKLKECILEFWHQRGIL